jgi:hypothetical protein
MLRSVKVFEGILGQPTHAKACQFMLSCANFQGMRGRGREFQGNTRENHIKMHGNERIRG